MAVTGPTHGIHEGFREPLALRVPLLSAADAGAARISLSGDNNYGLYRGGPTRGEGFAQCQFTCWGPDVPWSVAVTVQAG